MITLSLEDRLQVILSVFCQAYFGHVIIEKAIWSQLEDYCDNYMAIAESRQNQPVKNNHRCRTPKKRR